MKRGDNRFEELLTLNPFLPLPVMSLHIAASMHPARESRVTSWLVGLERIAAARIQEDLTIDN